MNSASYFIIKETLHNNITVLNSSLGAWEFSSSRTKASGLGILNDTEIGYGKIEVYL
jgi:hypothetical protein